MDLVVSGTTNGVGFGSGFFLRGLDPDQSQQDPQPFLNSWHRLKIYQWKCIRYDGYLVKSAEIGETSAGGLVGGGCVRAVTVQQSNKIIVQIQFGY